jgi:hypothetical protein
MRVLLINSFYYRRGGDCVHLLAQEQSLKAAGYEVAVFAMQHPQNLPSSRDASWPENVEFGERLGIGASALFDDHAVACSVTQDAADCLHAESLWSAR